MQVFTDENFLGYEFRCYTASANTGFKHVCDVYKDNNLLPNCTSIVNWGNRTWESYQFATVLQNSKDRVQTYIIEGHTDPEVDHDFLNTLANYDYIRDYGELETGETVIIFDSWEQVKGEDEREYVKGEGMVKTGRFKKSVYAKLVELAEKDLLKPSINSTIKNVEYVFSDEYARCDECGTIHNMQYGDLTWVEDEGMLLCDKCLNNSSTVENLIAEAKDDFRKALKPTVDQSIIEGLGYSLVTEETFSFEREFWGAEYMTIEYAKDFIERYNGFIQIYEVAQFVEPFQIWVPNEVLDEAQDEIISKFGVNV